MKLFKTGREKSTRRIPQIAPASALDVTNFQESSLSISAEISRPTLSAGPFSERESRLRVTISNAGEKQLENLSIVAIAPEGSLLVDPGILFGTTRRHVRLPRLAPSKSVTYKLGIRAQDGFTSGVLAIEVHENSVPSSNQHFQLKVGLSTI